MKNHDHIQQASSAMERPLSAQSVLHRTGRRVERALPQGISGLGGIGKTQTALEYAYRYGGEYDAVCWVRADSTIALVSSFTELAHLLNLSEQDERDQNVIVRAVLRWFQLHEKWLLIFDNIEDFLVAEPFLPKAGQGHIVFTTRARALAGIAQFLEVRKMG